MKLWRISQDKNNDFDTYDSAVVAAESKEDAIATHPSEFGEGVPDVGCVDRQYGTWTSKENIKCELIGEATEGVAAGVIVASFNAG